MADTKSKSERRVSFRIESIGKKRGLLRMGAKMMISSNPWNALYFTEEQCFNDLQKAELNVVGALGGEEDNLLGFLAAMPHGIGFEPMIEYLCVREDTRGRGIGTALVDYFETVMFPDADNYYLFVSDINPDAIRLYVRLGYLQVGAMPNFNLISQTEFLHRKYRRPRQEKARKAAIE